MDDPFFFLEMRVKYPKSKHELNKKMNKLLVLQKKKKRGIYIFIDFFVQFLLSF